MKLPCRNTKEVNTMFDHVLIAYDGSDYADRALEAAARLARGVGSKVTVFHARLEGPVPERIRELAPRQQSAAEAHSLGGFYDAASMHTEELDEIGRQLLEQASSALKTYGISNYETVTGAGDAATAMLKHARENGVDTIVIGSRGHSTLAEIVLGSVSHKIHHAFDGTTITVR